MAHFRWLRGAALAQALVLVSVGCHHKTVAVQPPPSLAPTASGGGTGTEVGANTSRPSGTLSGASAGTASVPPLEPQGKPLSVEVGLASWYGPPYHNRQAADGSIYDQNAMTAAHRELPMGSLVRVTNLSNNESVVVRITDRGPFVDGRIIDLSLAAAKMIDVYRPGTAKVRVEAYAPPAGYDPAGKWCVQIGAFLDEADAIQLKNDLARRFASAKVIEFAGPTGHWVRINPKNPDKTTASEIADSIHIPDPGAEPWIVRLN
jgi:rare lipoprotein A